MTPLSCLLLSALMRVIDGNVQCGGDNLDGGLVCVPSLILALHESVIG